jgi:hypothetical protein
LTRKAAVNLTIGTAAADTNWPVAVREVTEIPIKIVGRPRPKSSGSVVLMGITVPGVLLQGARLDLALDIQPPDARADRFQLQAEVEGPGLVADTAIGGSAAASANAPEIKPIMRVVAAVDAEPGVRPVRLRFEPTGSPAVVREVAVIVRPPIRVHSRPDPIALSPGASARIVVGIGREPGYDGPVELRVEGLPEGVRVSGRSVVPKGEAVGTVRLVRDATAPPIAREVAVRVVGVARMPRGPVSVDSAIRPMVRETLSEELGRESPE